MLFTCRPNFAEVALSTQKKKVLSRHVLVSGVDLNMDYYLTLTGGKIFVLVSGIWLIIEVLHFCASDWNLSIWL
jgi:hypothetical protein